MSKSTKDTLAYYSQSARFYMRAWLNEDVETSFRLQSINVWGMEGSSNAPATIYPKADGTPWVEEAYVHMPNMFNKHLDLDHRAASPLTDFRRRDDRFLRRPGLQRHPRPHQNALEVRARPLPGQGGRILERAPRFRLVRRDPPLCSSRSAIGTWA